MPKKKKKAIQISQFIHYETTSPYINISPVFRDPPPTADYQLLIILQQASYSDYYHTICFLYLILLFCAVGFQVSYGLCFMVYDLSKRCTMWGVSQLSGLLSFLSVLSILFFPDAFLLVTDADSLSHTLRKTFSLVFNKINRMSHDIL